MFSSMDAKMVLGHSMLKIKEIKNPNEDQMYVLKTLENIQIIQYIKRNRSHQSRDQKMNEFDFFFMI